MTEKLTRKQRLAEIRNIAWEVERLCQRHCSRELDALQAAAARQERQHRVAGKRICGKRYPASVRCAVELFTCKCILEPMAPPATWQAASAIRSDYLHGQAAREILTGADYDALAALQARWEQLGADYSSDIAGNR